MDTATPQLPGLSDSDSARGPWFSSMGCVVWSQDGEQAEVFVGGTLIGTFDRRERGARNVILVGLARDPKAHLGKLATAFGVNAETLRRIRLQHEEEGLGAVVNRAPGGSERKLQGAALRRAEQLFARGASLATVREALAKLHVTVSRATLSGERAQWRARTTTGADASSAATGNEPAAAAAAMPAQPELWDDQPSTSRATEDEAPRAASTATEDEAPMAVPTATEDEAPPAVSTATEDEAPTAAPAATATAASAPAFEEHLGAQQKVTGEVPRPGRFVQHLGSWLLLGSLAAMGVYAVFERERCRTDRPGRRLRRATVRVALDALIVALAVGQRCVEGVRRVQTLTAGILLRASGAPAATWVRRALGLLAGQSGASYIGLGLAGIHLRAAQAGTDDGPVVFYLDGHLRPYTGQEVVRKGWRMQDKRVLPGVTDCYVHDEDGRAAFRLDAPGHDSLTKLAPRVTALLRQALGQEERILVAFDRGGAFPEHLAELRTEGFEFVTYERRPYALLPPDRFTEKLTMPDGEVLTWCEPRQKNLGKGRGRVRRIAVREPDGRQINLVAISREPPPRLIAIMHGRWNQENAFKHAVERWGQNQLDARTVEPWSPETVIPNPARRRLDHALRLARLREGDARRRLAGMAPDDPRRARVEDDLAAALRSQRDLEAQRPHVPKRQELARTELADKLVRHVPDFKLLLDGVRVACANAEADLAAMLARHMRRPREAKKLLATVFAAPGHITVNAHTITVSLLCPGSRGDQRAIEAFLDAATAAKLPLPGDSRCRRLVFRSLESPD